MILQLQNVLQNSVNCGEFENLYRILLKTMFSATRQCNSLNNSEFCFILCSISIPVLLYHKLLSPSHQRSSFYLLNSSVTFGIRLVCGTHMVLKLPELCVTRREDVTFREVILRFLARRGVLRLF